MDLRQSAPQVGETQEEYDRHLKLVEGVLPAVRQRQRNGVRGLAQALWRRRRVFVSRVQRETFSFYLELEKAAVWGLCPASVQGLEFVTTDVFVEGEHPRLEEIVECLDKRLVRVAEAYLTEQAEKLVQLEVWGEHRYRADFLDQPPEVIGNGLLPRGQVKRRMKKEPKGNLKHTALWAWKLKVARTKSGLLKAWVGAGNRLPDPRREEDFGLHLRLMEAAFFGDRHAGFGLAGSAGVPPAGVGQCDRGQAGETPALPGLDYRVAKFQAAQPELYQGVRNLAEATWQRLRVFACQAEKEAKDLREKLERAARGTLGPGPKSLKELWREARDRRLAEAPRDPIDEAIWANFQQALEKAKAEKQKSEAGSQKQEARIQDSGVRIQDSEVGTSTGTTCEIAEPQIENPKSKTQEQSAIDNRQSSIPGQSSILDDLHLQWRVERMIGVFLCSEAYQALKAAKQCNRRVEEAFRALEGALEPALQRLVG